MAETNELNGAVSRLKQDLATGKVKADELLGMLDLTNLLPGAKEAVRQQIVSANTLNTDTLGGEEQPEVATAQEPEVISEPLAQQEETVTAEPQQAPSLLRSGSFFFEPSQVGSGFFENYNLSFSKPKDPIKSAEMGMLVSAGNAAYGVEDPVVVETIATELSTTGESQAFTEYVTMRNDSEIRSIRASLWENLEALTGVARDPEVGLEIEQQIEQEITDVKVTDPTSQLIADLTFNLTPQQLQIFKQFEFFTGEALYRRSLNDMLNMKEAEASEKADWLDWVETLTTPFIGADLYLTRRDSGELLKRLNKGLGESTSISEYVFKAEHGNIVADYLTEEGVSTDVLMTRIDEVEQLLNEMDNIDDSFNPLNGAELIAEIRSKLGTQAISRGAVSDVIDATFLAALVKPLRSLGKLVGAKFFGKTAMKGASWNRESIDALNATINSLIDDSTIASRAVVKPTTQQAVVPTAVKSNVVADLEARASQAISTQERKELEATKKVLGSELARAKDISVDDLTKELQAEGMKFKAARKAAEKQKSDLVAAAQKRYDNHQELINEADFNLKAKGELERIRQGVVEVPDTGLPVQRNQGSTLDAVAAANPKQAEVMLKAAVEAGDTSALGVSAENVVERMMPIGNNPVGIHPNLLTGQPSNIPRVNAQSDKLTKFSTELQDHSSIDLLRQDELAEVADKYVAMVTANSRGTLHPSVSPISSGEGTTMKVQATFGKDQGGGYASIQEAEDAAKFLFSDNYEILAKPKGIQSELMSVADIPADFAGEVEFFVRHNAEIRPDSRYTNPLPEDMLFPGNVVTDSVQSVSKRIDKELFDIFSSFTDKSTRLAQLLSEISRKVLKMNAGRDKDQWTKMLAYGDDNEIVFATKQEAEDILGTRITNAAWEGYTSTREVYDALAQVRQRSAYRRLNANGFKSAYTEAGILEDVDGLVHVRPITERPVLRSTKPSPDEQGVGSTVWGNEVYDVSTGKYVTLSDDMLDSMYEGSDFLVVQLSRNAEFTPGKLSAHAIVKTSSIRELVQNPMSVRRGHVDINYAPESLGLTGFKGGNRYKIDVNEVAKVNGIDNPYKRAIGIYANEKQANEARASIVAREIEELGDDATEEAIKAVEAKYEVDITREEAIELGLDTAGTLNNLPAHARKRGNEALLGPSGPADILSMEEALTKGLREARNLLGVESIEMMKARFLKSFGSYMENGGGFHENFAKFQFLDEAVKNGIIDQAEAWHRNILNMQRSLSGTEVSLFLHRLDRHASALANEGKTGKAAALRAVSRGFDKALQLNKELTTTFFIASRTFYQVLANSSQIMWLAAQNPYDFANGAVRGSLGAMMAITSRGKLPSSVLAKAINKNMTGEQFDLYMKHMRESGLFSTNLADDILSAVAGTARVEAGRHKVTSAAYWGRLLNPAEANRVVGKALGVPQTAAINMANFVSYNHAASQLIRKKGIDYALSRKGRQEILANTRRLTFNQNRADQFLYQQNVVGNTQFMFVQHVHRMYMDMMVDPALRLVSPALTGAGKVVEAATLGKVKVGKVDLKTSVDGTNLYADSWAQSAMTLGMTASMIGLGNLMPESAADSIEDSMREAGVDQKIITTFLDGLVGLAAEETFEERYDFASRLTHSGALTSMIEMMRTNDGGWIIGGAGLAVPSAFSDMGKIAKAYYTSDKMDADTAIDLMGKVGTKYLAGLRDAEKAYIAYRWNQYVDSNGKPLAHVKDMGWLPTLFSIPPESVQNMYDQLDKVYDTRDKAKDVSKWGTKVAQSFLQDVAPDEVTGDRVIEAAILGMKVIDTLTDGEPNLAKLAKDNFIDTIALDPDGMLARHAEKMFETLESKDAIAELERMKALNPEQSDLIDFLVDSLKRREE